MSNDHAALAADGFQNGSRYHNARPNYPDDAVRHLATALDVASASLVVDVGAGTGIFTGQIAPFCPRIVAVEPSAGMRDEFRSILPEIEIIDGRDSAVPFDSHSVDVITVAQAFHWFDPAVALHEFSRVLTPLGRLGLIWNERDESVPWVRELGEAILWPHHQPYRVGMDFSPVLATGPFTEIERLDFTHHQILTFEGLQQRVLTTSYIAIMTPEEQAVILSDVAAVVEGLREPFDLPYVTTTYVAHVVVN